MQDTKAVVNLFLDILLRVYQGEDLIEVVKEELPRIIELLDEVVDESVYDELQYQLGKFMRQIGLEGVDL